MHLLRTTLLAIACLGTFLQDGNAGTGSNPNHSSQKKEKMNVIALTKNDFLKKVYNFEASPEKWKFEGNKPCIVDFFAAWCGPCKALAPRLEEIAANNDGKINVYKIDVDKEPELAERFGIRSVPTLLFCPANGDPQLLQGAASTSQLQKAVDEVLLKEK